MIFRPFDFPSFPLVPIIQITSLLVGSIYSSRAVCHVLKITLSISIIFLCFIYISSSSLYSWSSLINLFVISSLLRGETSYVFVVSKLKLLSLFIVVVLEVILDEQIVSF